MSKPSSFIVAGELSARERAALLRIIQLEINLWRFENRLAELDINLDFSAHGAGFNEMTGYVADSLGLPGTTTETDEEPSYSRLWLMDAISEAADGKKTAEDVLQDIFEEIAALQNEAAAKASLN